MKNVTELHNGKYQCHNYGKKLHLPPTNYYLLAAQQESQTSPTLNENCSEFSAENLEIGPAAKRCVCVRACVCVHVFVYHI